MSIKPAIDVSEPPQTSVGPAYPYPEPELVRSLPAGVRVQIHGRTVHLRHLRRPPTGLLRWVLLLGPGFIAAMAGDDAGGIATFSSAGAKFGYQLLWMLALIAVALAAVMEMCSRLGAATGRGLLDLVRERFGIGWTLLAVGIVLLANGGIVITEFAGIAAAAELLGISRYLAVPLCAALIWYLVIKGTYGRVEKLFLVMTLAFLAYPAAALLARPDWTAVARGAAIPVPRLDREYVTLLLALVGTTIAPYIQLFQQSSVVEKGTARRHYGPERLEACVGAFSSTLIAASVVIATAATLHVAGQTNIETAADAAQALRPVAGDAAQYIFALGLLGASLLAAGVLPLATAFAVSEAFGFRKGLNVDFRRAPIFLGLFSVLLVTGAAVALVPGLPLIPLLVGIQVLNGVLLPIVLLFLLLLINDRRLVGDLKNGKLSNAVGWGILLLVAISAATLLATQGLDWLGIKLFGGG